MITPLEIFTLALKRHREPWNWTLHFVSLFGFALTFLTHSYLMLAATLIVFGAGFYQLGLPALPDNRWSRFVHSAVEWEKDWIAYPWTFRKWVRFLFVVVMIFIAILACWAQEFVAISLLVGFGYLGKVVLENKAGGINP